MRENFVTLVVDLKEKIDCLFEFVRIEMHSLHVLLPSFRCLTHNSCQCLSVVTTLRYCKYLSPSLLARSAETSVPGRHGTVDLPLRESPRLLHVVPGGDLPSPHVAVSQRSLALPKFRVSLGLLRDMQRSIRGIQHQVW